MPQRFWAPLKAAAYPLALTALLTCAAELFCGRAFARCDDRSLLNPTQDQLNAAFANGNGVLPTSICITQSNVTLDCGDKWIDPDPLEIVPGWPPAIRQTKHDACITIKDGAQGVTIRNCKVKNCNVGVSVDTRPGADNVFLLGYGYWNGADMTAFEDELRAAQPHHISIDRLEAESVLSGLFVFKYATNVTLSSSKISASEVGVYLDTGTQYNVIRDSTFSTPASSREAIAVDASAYNQILRNRFEGGWKAGIELYKNCGEQWFNPARPQPAMWNRIKYNTFGALPVGVHIASRADKLIGNWKESHTAATADDYDPRCADRIYHLPPNPGPPSILRDVVPALTYRGDAVYRQAYYRDRAPNNIVRCNSFAGLSAVVVKDDNALVEGNVSWASSSTVTVYSQIRSLKSEPVKDVHVMNNMGSMRLSCPAGGCVTDRTNVNMYWGEPEGCNDIACYNGQSTCPRDFAYSKPSSRPIGYIDTADRTQACGWAVDMDHPNDSIAVHVYVDWANGVAGTANLPSPDVNAAFHVTGNHRFCIPISVPAGTHSVVAYGIDVEGIENPSLTGSPKEVIAKMPPRW